MASFNGFILTEKGRELLAKGLAGDTITFTKMQVGDGTSTNDPKIMTALVNVKQTLNLISINATGGICKLGAVLSNKDLTVGYYIKELGIFAKGNDNIEVLYAYNVSTSPDFVPPFTSNNVVEIEYQDSIIVDQVANVTAHIDPSITYLTLATANGLYALKTTLASTTTAGLTKYGTLSGTALEGHQMARILGIADDFYGGLISTVGTKTIGKAYYDTNTKQIYLCKETNNLSYVDLNKFTAFSNKSLLDKLNGLIFEDLSQSGYSKIGNLVMQWGNTVDGASSVNFPTPFLNAIFSIQLTRKGGTGGGGSLGQGAPVIGSYTGSFFTFDSVVQSSDKSELFWFAVGY